MLPMNISCQNVSQRSNSTTATRSDQTGRKNQGKNPHPLVFWLVHH